LLKKLLLSFRRENLTVADDLQKAIANGDMQLARRLVHTVKGVGGNLGTTELCRAALRLEAAMQGGELLGPAMEAFEVRLAEVLGSILALDKEVGDIQKTCEPPSVQASPVENWRLATLARKLSCLLDAHNLKALGVWEEMRPMLTGEAADRLESTLHCLDFGDASQVLAVIMQDLEISP
jgi:HPt (histidine-containing phosphotransfer) domain-containing protein